MDRKTTVVLAGLLALQVAAYLAMVLHERRAEPATPPFSSLLGEGITSIRITARGQEVELRRGQGFSWEVIEPVRCPADPHSLDRLVTGLESIEVERGAPRPAGDLRQLGLIDGAGKRVQVRMGQKIVADFFAGSVEAGRTLVRVAGKGEVLAVRGNLHLALDRKPEHWCNRARRLSHGPGRAAGSGSP